MTPTELHTLFTDQEQTLLVTTERARLKGLDEDDLDELLTRVRRARNKYTKLYRRQSAELVAAKSSRAGTSTSNQRTKRKAEIFEDALARVASALAAAAQATSNTLKQERLAAARAAKGTPTGASGRSSEAGSRATSRRRDVVATRVAQRRRPVVHRAQQWVRAVRPKRDSR